MFLTGCWFVRIGIRNMGDAVFDSPIRVMNKIKHPVKDSVRLSALWVWAFNGFTSDG